jgi:DHA2 family multidrug resistance protein
LSIVGFVVFMVVELNIREPLIDLSLLKNFNFGMANLVLFIFGMGMFGSTFLLPLYLQNALGYTAFQAGSLFLPVGIIMAVMAPIAGQLSDKVNPKIPALIGIIILSASLFVNRTLSLFSETSTIMVSLYLRGFGMALIFTPLSALALTDIPRERMAQASGLFNVLRQIGGSFGVALMGTLLTQRTAYHLTVYGESLNQRSPSAQQALGALKLFSQHAVGGASTVSSMRAQILVGYHLAQQAFVSAVDDDFLVAAAITILCVIPILLLKYKKKGKTPGPKVVAME